jgi:hypothetical protein
VCWPKSQKGHPMVDKNTVLLRTILTLQVATLRKGFKLMALGQDILDAVTAETSVIDSFIALVEGLIANGTVSAEQGVAILKAIGDEKAKVEAAILAHTPPVV